MVRKFVLVVRVNSKKKLPFMSKDIKKLISKRERLFRIYRATNKDIDFTKYKELKNTVNQQS